MAGVEQNTTRHAEKLIAALGASLGIVGVYWVSHWYLDHQGALLMVASMGASAVLLFAVPHGALSQPWPVVAGHLSSAFVGIVCQKLLGDSPWAPALAVGLAVGVMCYLRCIHPPGGATALTAVIGGDAVQAAGFDFMIFPVMINVVSIMLVAVVFNAPFSWRRYPAHLTRRLKTAAVKPAARPFELTHEDFAAAMQDLNSFIDITADDLVRLVELATTHAEQHATHPTEIIPGRYYSNGQLGQRWSVCQVIDASEASSKSPGKIIYKTVAGDGAYDTGICPTDTFRRWARFEVKPYKRHWLRVVHGPIADPSVNGNP